MTDETVLQKVKVSRATMVITVILMVIVVAGIVVLPFFTESAPGTNIYQQRREADADERINPTYPDPSESVQFTGVRRWLQLLP